MSYKCHRIDIKAALTVKPYQAMMYSDCYNDL